jgi:hypothetical protein
MKWPDLLLIIIILILFSNCEKDITENHPDRINSAFKFFILDSNKVEHNTKAKLYRVNDSVFFLNGYNDLTQNDCFYKLMFSGNNFEIKNMKPLINGTPGDIKDISFPNYATGYLL